MKLMILLLAAGVAYGVTISDTLTLPDSTLASGRLTISLVTGTSSTSTTFAAFRRDITVTAGVVSVDLTPNTQLTPPGTLYKVEYFLARGLSQTEYWSVPTGGPYTIRDVRWAPTTQDYSVNQSGATWTITAAAHGQRHKNLIVACYDSSGNAVECATNVNPTTYAVTARFAAAQTGRVIINGSSLGGYMPNPAKAFTSATSVTFANSEHNLNTARVVGKCYDSTGDDFECQISVDQTTFSVTASWIGSKTGLLVISGK